MAHADPTCRRAFRPRWKALLALALCLLPSCDWDGNFCVLGYSTKPNYRTDVHTVYVPIFQNRTFYRGLEFDLTQAVVREIEAKTPYKVVSDCERADTELSGTIISFNKYLLNYTQNNEVREAQTILVVEVYWRDLRTGEVLSVPRPRGAEPPEPRDRFSGKPLPPPAMTQVESISGFIPELGESITTAQKKNVDRVAVQIISMMECPW